MWEWEKYPVYRGRGSGIIYKFHVKCWSFYDLYNVRVHTRTYFIYVHSRKRTSSFFWCNSFILWLKARKTKIAEMFLQNAESFAKIVEPENLQRKKNWNIANIINVFWHKADPRIRDRLFFFSLNFFLFSLSFSFILFSLSFIFFSFLSLYFVYSFFSIFYIFSFLSLFFVFSFFLSLFRLFFFLFLIYFFFSFSLFGFFFLSLFFFYSFFSFF